MKRLEKLLENGPVAVTTIKEDLGVPEVTLKRWKKKLGLNAFKVGNAWHWELPKGITRGITSDEKGITLEENSDTVAFENMTFFDYKEGVQYRTPDGHPFYYINKKKYYGLIEAPGIGSVDRVPDYSFPKREPVEDLTGIPYEDLLELVNEYGLRSAHYDELVRRKTIELRSK